MRVLIVAGECSLRASLARSFRGEGYAADAADSAQEGLFKAENYSYDAIVLDVILSAPDGWTLLERLRLKRTTPILMLIERDSPDERVRGLDLGADDCLVHPFDLRELLARLRALIRRAVGHPRPMIELGEVWIDTRSRLTTRSGRVVTLTAREYSILEYLALHRGQVVSRTELYEHLLDENEDTLSNLMDVHIFGIRKKLGGDLISTRRGQGYCID